MAIKKYWIHDAVKKPGALRKTAKTKKGKNIPKAVMEKLSKSKNAKTRKRAQLALNFAKMRKKK